MNPETETLRSLVTALEESLAGCARDPDVEAVHRTRTGTRRIEAQLDTLVRSRQSPEGEFENGHEAFGEAVGKLRRLLKKIRRAAAPARDLDVHRKLLDTMIARPEGEQPDAVADPVRDQAEKLDHWLKHGREHHALHLQKVAAKWAGRLEEDLARLEASLPTAAGRRRAPDAARSALDAFALLSTHMQNLDAMNLHDFRKGAKKARYMAEAGGQDHAAAVGKALKKLQDEIGDWHDWLMLAEEAHSALGEEGQQLIARLEEQRDRHYAEAMRVSERMRGRLMGEWQSLKPVRSRRPLAAH